MRDSASSSDDFLRVDLPAEIWRNSDRPRFGAVIRLYVAVTLTITAVVMLTPGPLYWGLIGGAVAVFALTPMLVNRRLDSLEQRLQSLDPNEANAMLRELPKRRLVRYFAPFAWLPLQQARLHLRRGDGRAAALAFAETARISRVDASTPALVSAEATAALMGGDRKRTLQLLRKLEQQDQLRPQDHLHFGLALLLDRGKPAVAQTHLEAAQEGIGGHPRVLAGLAFASHRAGDPKRASELLETIAASDTAVDPLASDLIKRTQKGLRTFLKAKNKRSKRSKRERDANRAKVVKQNPAPETKPTKPVATKPVATKPVAAKPVAAKPEHVSTSTSLPVEPSPVQASQAAPVKPKKKQPKPARGKKARKQARREARRLAKAQARSQRRAEAEKTEPKPATQTVKAASSGGTESTAKQAEAKSAAPNLAKSSTAKQAPEAKSAAPNLAKSSTAKQAPEAKSAAPNLAKSSIAKQAPEVKSAAPSLAKSQPTTPETEKRTSAKPAAAPPKHRIEELASPLAEPKQSTQSKPSNDSKRASAGSASTSSTSSTASTLTDVSSTVLVSGTPANSASKPASASKSSPALKPPGTKSPATRFQAVPNRAHASSTPTKPVTGTSTTARTKPRAPSVPLSTKPGPARLRPPTGASLFGQSRQAKQSGKDLPTRAGLPTRPVSPTEVPARAGLPTRPSPVVSPTDVPTRAGLPTRPSPVASTPRVKTPVRSKPVPASTPVTPRASSTGKISTPKIVAPSPAKPRLATPRVAPPAKPRLATPARAPARAPVAASMPTAPRVAPPVAPSIPTTAPKLAPPVAPTIGAPLVAPTLPSTPGSAPAVSAPQLRRVETPHTPVDTNGLFSDDDWDDVLSSVDELDLGA